ncbi:MAG: DUF924 family protein [Pseudomonadota bacterium]|nr:DUF924 family protein [Pseudomonadota bacterium]
MTPETINAFWFEKLEPRQWWQKDPVLDQNIRDHFSAIHAAAMKCELWQWRNTAEGRLAEILVLDQFSRNIYRDTPNAFACDPLALALAQEAIQLGVDDSLPDTKRAFLYMPYMHSESRAIHQEAVLLFSSPGLESQLDFELKHQAIIDRFGRYPHRNAILGRMSTAEENQFLTQADSSF